MRHNFRYDTFLYQYSILWSDGIHISDGRSGYILCCGIMLLFNSRLCYWYSILDIYVTNISSSILHIIGFQLYRIFRHYIMGINLQALLPVFYFGFMCILHSISFQLSTFFPVLIYMELAFYIESSYYYWFAICISVDWSHLNYKQWYSCQVFYHRNLLKFRRNSL